ncbi:hypothetical protein RND81_04G218900 [Saponaria officinalis]|uniref:J domain-containing protein n=1 Tax=Saponaria officinalis TaxID=3572 RepID=A0AAW1LNW7_SAPOF
MEEREGVGSNGGGASSSNYYAVLGIRKDASFSDVRSAYRKLALKWHPDRWATDSSVAGEAKRRFQQIQEAYSVLSDQGKRSMYDAGFYDPTEEVDQGFSDFMQEMMTMMDNVRGSSEGDSLEDLQKMFVEMVSGDGMCFTADQTASKRPRCSSPRRNITVRRNSSRC